MLRRRHRSGRRLVDLLLMPVLVAALAGGIVGVMPAPTAAAAPVGGADGDGLTAQTAGASCWGIKQTFPSSGDGVYWVVTPRLVTPRQVWCDQTTDGGGWVLVGRGREGWNWRDGGQGTQAAIAATPAGPAAFAPATYTSSIVDGLLNGQAPQDLADGVRLRRAEALDGSSYQDIRWSMRWTPRWTWSFGAGIPVVRADWANGVTVAGGTTYDNVQGGANNGWTRIWTWQWNGRSSFGQGFAYGSAGPAAENGPSAYLWQSPNGEGHAVPFSQVYVRPRITNSGAGFTAIPDAGTPASTLRPLMKNAAEPLTWGVVGRDTAQAPATSSKVTVTSLAQVGERVFVGGIFTGVQQGATGAPVPQRFLAAFDRSTGAWISDFRPDLNGGVWALEASGNRLIVGGRFTTVNGLAQAGLVALDPLTGAVDPTWKVTLTGAAGGLPAVRSLLVQSGWVYFGGSVTLVSGGTGTDVRSGVRGRSLFRVAATNGKPDHRWLPQVAGTPWWLSGSATRGDRIYLAGKITTVNGTALAAGVGAVSAAPGAALVNGSQNVRSRYVCEVNCGPYRAYGQAVIESADGRSVFAATTRHTMQQVARDTFAPENSALYGFKGGDVQAIAEVDGVVYSACRCFHWSYRNSFDENVASPQPGPWERVSSVTGIGAHAATDLDKIDEWEPSWKGAFDDGTWSFLVDSSKCLWTGGDVVRRGSAWAGGFLKFCPRDTVAPQRPTGLAVARDGTGAPVLTWTGGSDAAGAGFRYEVLREDRVVAVTTARSWTTTGRLAAGRYAVRTVDTAGNRSASTAIVVVPQSPDQDAALPLVLDPAAVQVRDFEGWGTSLSWGANVVGGWSDSTRNEVADLLFSESKGLGLNITRYHIGGGLNPDAQQLGCGKHRLGSPLPVQTADGTADANQRWFLRAAQDRGADKAIAFVSSPPYWLLANGCTNGSGATNSLPGYWSYQGDGTGAHKGTTSYSGTAGDSVTIRFVGEQIHFYGAKGPDAGIVAFSVDGGPETMVDAYSATRVGNAWLYVTPVLRPGEHTLTVRVTGEKNPASGNTYVSPDSAIVLPDWTVIDDQDRGTGANQMNFHWKGYEEFADHVAMVTQKLRDVDDVTLDYVNPINEAEADWWVKNGIQEGAHFDWAGQEEIARRTAEALAARGVTKTKLALNDANTTSSALRDYDQLSASTKQMTSAIFAHTYWTTPADAKALRDRATAEGKVLWQSEFSTGGGLQATDPTSVVPALSLAERIVGDLNNLRPQAWLLWDGIESYEENAAANSTWGPILGRYSDPEQTYVVAKQFYGFKNFTRFIRPGATFIASGDDTNTVVAYDRDRKRLTIVTVNTGTTERAVGWDLSKFSSVSKVARYRTSGTMGEDTRSIGDVSVRSQQLVDTVAPRSVTTYVIDTVTTR